MKVIVVTGANKGIGFAIVDQILSHHEDCFVYLGARNAQRGEEACEKLMMSNPSRKDRLGFLQLDVASDHSVKDAAGELAKRLGGQKVFAIVNNAGIGLPEMGLKPTLEVNLYGIKRVCEAFIPLMNQEEGRIVNITSASGPNFVYQCSSEKQGLFVKSTISWDEIEGLIQEGLALKTAEDFSSMGFGDGSSYGFSKACANSYTMYLAAKYPHLTINACTPGFIETDLTRPLAESRGASPEEMGMKAPVEGTKSALFLLFGQPYGSGHYYGSDAKRSPLDRYRAPGSEEYRG